MDDVSNGEFHGMETGGVKADTTELHGFPQIIIHPNRRIDSDILCESRVIRSKSIANKANN